MCGCCPRFTMIHPCGDSLTARLLHQYGRPNLLLDPTHLFPHSKNTTSLPDMLLSRGFLWRCLKATVPAMTLSRGTEALQLQGPSWVFLNEGLGVGGCRSASFSFIHSITFTHRPHTPPVHTGTGTGMITTGCWSHCSCAEYPSGKQRIFLRLEKLI